MAFIAMNDGSTVKIFKLSVTDKNFSEESLKDVTTVTSLRYGQTCREHGQEAERRGSGGKR